MADSTPDSVLTLRELAVSFGGNHVLRSVDLDVPTGFTGLVGPNGAGKTTVFNVVSGYVRAAGGDVRLGGETLIGVAPDAIARRGVGRTFQTPKLVAGISVVENVMLGLDGRAGPLAHLRAVLGSRRESRPAREQSLDLLERFGIADRANSEASALPLATQKIVEVARALIARPRLVLLDEPAAGLGAEDVEAMVAPLVELAADNDLSVVIIEHDLALVSRLCPRLAVLHQGGVIALGTPAEVLAQPEVVDAYLGAGFAAVGP
ncbi:ABC transporter ATP-binding protein [Sporichthya polymorpha]|uniref:ABC transporter ATP-binding protein n=1 Tax=Sporichthya polymorpha TaxID=35751 RepID=UPI000365CB79|nr:ABC transporter ATP-binding protein [Sporichthya polymorpha]